MDTYALDSLESLVLSLSDFYFFCQGKDFLQLG